MAVLAKPEPPPASVAWRGYVETAPTGLGEEFTVTVPSFDDAYVFEIRRWEARGTTIPAVGDEVFVMLDDQQEPWAPAWWPAEGDAPIEGGGEPTGPAGGVLSGEYPNPGFAVDMATQAELDAHVADTTGIHGIADTSQLALKSELGSGEWEEALAAEKAARESADAERVVGPASAKDGGLVAFDGTTGKKIKAAGKIVAEQIEAGTITATLIASHTITANEIAAGTITSTEIASATITGGNIASGTVTASNISVSKLSALSADLGTITAGTVTGATLQTATEGSRVVIDSAGLRAYKAAEAVLDFDISTGNLSLKGEVKSGSVVPASVVTGQLTNAQLKEIEAAKITGQVNGTQIEAGSITSGHIAANTIVAGDIAAGTITATEIKSGTITATQIASGTITTTEIKAGTILGEDIAATTITGSNIAANTIAASKLTVSELSAITANLGTITAGTITGATFRTSATNPKVVMDSSGFRIEEASLTPLNITAASGVVFAAGNEAEGNGRQKITWTLGGKLVTEMSSIGSEGAEPYGRFMIWAQRPKSPPQAALLDLKEAEGASGRINASIGSNSVTLINGSAQSSFLQLATLASRKVALGETSVTIAKSATTSNEVTVNHGLGVKPVAVLPMLERASGGSTYGFRITSRTTTQFKFIVNVTPATGAEETDTIGWLAVG